MVQYFWHPTVQQDDKKHLVSVEYLRNGNPDFHHLGLAGLAAWECVGMAAACDGPPCTRISVLWDIRTMEKKIFFFFSQ